MIHVVVSINHLRDEFEIRRGEEQSAALCHALWPLFGKPLLSVKSLDDLKHISVYELLSRFHERAIQLIRQRARNLIIEHRDRLTKTAHSDYHQPLFKATEEDAAASLALHGLFPHGAIATQVGNPGDAQAIPVVLPDFLISSRLYADFPDEYWGRLCNEVPPAELFQEWKDHDPANATDALKNVYASIDGTVTNLSTRQRRLLECHLCDRLEAVYRRAIDYWTDSDLRGSGGLDQKPAEAIMAAHQGGDAILVVGAIPSFRGYQSLRSHNPDMPPVGHHPLLTSAAIRQGVARPVASSCFSMGVWSACTAPVRHFLLHAAEIVGRSQCQPLIPQVPLEDQMNSVYKAAENVDSHRRLGRGHYLNGPPNIQGFDTERYASVLDQLGIEAAFRKMQSDGSEAANGWGWAWIRTIAEFHGAMFEDNVERSLHLQDVLDLYPLHKRVLGLVEYILLPKIGKTFSQQDGKLPDVAKGASGLWTVAFTGAEDSSSEVRHGQVKYSPVGQEHFITRIYDPLIMRPAGANWRATWKQDGKKATMESEGNWLVNADRQKASGPIDLAALLDGIVVEMSTATGVSIKLQPLTPQDHALQLAALADRTNHNAACMTLYLGKLALMLRNAVEHGTDQVEVDGLVIATAHFWTEDRGRVPVFDWAKNTAKQVSWRSQGLLPKTLPNAAKAILLTPASLHRCLVLLSLVMRAAFSQLGI